MEVKILGVVVAVPPLSSPAHLFRWFLAWKRSQILLPTFQHMKEAMIEATEAIKRFAQAMDDADIEEEQD